MRVETPLAYAGRFATALEAAWRLVARSALADAGGSDAPPRLITALSGGVDSTALALLAQAYATAKGIAHSCVIVDHGLRPQAGEEARRVAARMKKFGIPSSVETIATRPPQGGIQHWARDQRYKILLTAARQSGAVLLVGHHAGDQAETVFMRLSRGSGLDGLSGMRPAREVDGVCLLRPLLAWHPQELSTICRAFECAFETDPSNQDRRFERVRTRALLRGIDASGQPMTGHLTQLATGAQRLCHRVDSALAQHLDLPVLHPLGYASFTAATLDDLPDSLWRRVVGQAMSRVSGGGYPASQAAFTRLRAHLGRGRGATLGGCRFARRVASDKWYILPEAGRRPETRDITAGGSCLFAGVWRVTSPLAGRVRWLGTLPPSPEWAAVETVVKRCFPVVETLDGGLLYPQLGMDGAQAAHAGEATAVFVPFEATARAVQPALVGTLTKKP